MTSIADRVRDVIRASGLSQRDFGARIGLDETKLSKSLSGTRRFSSVDLARIADLSGRTVDWFVTGTEPQLAVAARTSGGNATDALRIARQYSGMRSDMAALGFPQPWRPVPIDLTNGTYRAQGQRLAGAASARIPVDDIPRWGSGFLDAVESAFGVDICIAEIGSGQEFDGLAVSADGVKLIVLTASAVPARQRFTLAHELGHLLAGDDQGFHLDQNIFDPAQRRDPTEQRANAFAAAFLMPEATLRRAVEAGGFGPAAFAALVCDLVVSPSALAYRMLDLRFIDSGLCDEYRSLTAAKAATLAGRSPDYSRQVITARTPRPPGLLVRDTYMAYEQGKSTLRPYATLAGLDEDGLRAALETASGEYEIS
ncbi:XRE family transcriptional regulator [Nocardia rhamnosiphila]|uniref:helix-turn-helix domain-containing protein n=1 Tax=Nocardia rhamnosiphila TaxID=426716 RepID=UPI0033D3C872